MRSEITHSTVVIKLDNSIAMWTVDTIARRALYGLHFHFNKFCPDSPEEQFLHKITFKSCLWLMPCLLSCHPFSLPLDLTTCSTANGSSKEIPSGVFIPPFLLLSTPDFFRMTITTGKGNVVIIFWWGTISVSHVQFCLINWEAASLLVLVTDSIVFTH